MCADDTRSACAPDTWLVLLTFATGSVNSAPVVGMQPTTNRHSEELPARHHLTPSGRAIGSSFRFLSGGLLSFDYALDHSESQPFTASPKW
jgi:hypothetical protein